MPALVECVDYRINRPKAKQRIKNDHQLFFLRSARHPAIPVFSPPILTCRTSTAKKVFSSTRTIFELRILRRSFLFNTQKKQSETMSEVLEKAKQAIPAEVRMISGCRDSQTSADVSNVESFQLPDPAGRAGGALTSALLNVTYADHTNTGKDLTFQETLLAIREQLLAKKFEQIPQLSSSRPMDMKTTFDLVPENMSGTRRAVLM
jgi:hypothetical protein